MTHMTLQQAKKIVREAGYTLVESDRIHSLNAYHSVDALTLAYFCDANEVDRASKAHVERSICEYLVRKGFVNVTKTVETDAHIDVPKKTTWAAAITVIIPEPVKSVKTR